MERLKESVTLEEPVCAVSINSEGLAASFEKHGYIAIKGAIDHRIIDSHLASLDIFDRAQSESATSATTPVQEMLTRLQKRHAFQESHVPTLQVQFAPTLMAALKHLLRQEPAALFTTVFRVSPLAGIEHSVPTLSPHLHNFEIVTDPQHSFILAWVALEDISLDAGPMWIQPGSHKRWQDFPAKLAGALRLRRPHIIPALQSARAFPLSLAQLSDLLEEIALTARELIFEATESEPLRASPVLFSKGDCLIFDPSLMHGTLPPRTNVSRNSCNIRYVGTKSRLWNYADWLRSDGNLERVVEIERHFRVNRYGTSFLDFLGARYKGLLQA